MKGRSFAIGLATIGLVTSSLLTPSSAQARPAGVVVSITKVSVAKPEVRVHFVIKGQALLKLVVTSSSGYGFVADQVRARTGKGVLGWNRHVNGRPAAHGVYTLTVSARHGSARCKSSAKVDLE
jgi:hypothetical protein